MKTLRSLIVALALLITTDMVKAEEPTLKVKGSRAYAVNAYVSTMTQGRSEGLSDAIDQSAKFSTLRGKQVMCFDKADLLKFAQQNENVQQACRTTTTELESNDELSVIKMEMRYENFTRTNYLTLANTGEGWKITNVYSVFK